MWGGRCGFWRPKIGGTEAGLLTESFSDFVLDFSRANLNLMVT
jgi:hypothetical protein